VSGLAVENLSVSYRTPRGRLQVLRDVSLDVAPGEVLGLVGESGSGKSTLAYAVVDYLAGNAQVDGGSIAFDRAPLLGASPERLKDIRGKLVGMVYQDPSTALNPSLRLGEQVAESLVRHEDMTRQQAESRTAELLAMVRLPDPRLIMRRYPHEVSGGEKQRVLIAMAFACRPRLLVFDEPTTALDATTAASILDLIRGLQQEIGAAALYITHDLGLVAEIAQRVAVIYGGRIVEQGETARVLAAPRHFYTRMLVASAPNPHRDGPRRRLVSFRGQPPDLLAPPPGCIFTGRCPARLNAPPACAPMRSRRFRCRSTRPPPPRSAPPARRCCASRSSPSPMRGAACSIR
jgi:peptide/nickel transport system ATP-binding protein